MRAKHHKIKINKFGGKKEIKHHLCFEDKETKVERRKAATQGSVFPYGGQATHICNHLITLFPVWTYHVGLPLIYNRDVGWIQFMLFPVLHNSSGLCPSTGLPVGISDLILAN